MEKIDLVYPIAGKVIGKKDEYIEFSHLEIDQLERLLKEVSKFDYKYKKDDDMLTVQFNSKQGALFVEISFATYKRLCGIFFKHKIEAREEKELN